MIEKEQQLLARVLDLFAQRFDKKAVLRGGMVLRVLGSPRRIRPRWRHDCANQPIHDW